MSRAGMSGADEPSIVLYTQRHCAPCRAVERFLSDRGLAFDKRDVLRDKDALADLETQGYLGTPVTRIGSQWIAGFNRAALEQAISALARA